MAPGVVVHHVDAGPAEPVSKDDMLVHMEAFAEELVRAWADDRPDVVHAHFWMSGHAALLAARETKVPVVQTFHALGVVKRRYQGDKDTSPPERFEIERGLVRRADEIVATCTDEVFELVRLGAARRKLTVVPCGVDLALFSPDGPREPRRPGRRRLLCVGRLVERKGIGNVIEALAEVPDAELVVAGGPPRDQLADDPEAKRLRGVAERAGVADRVDLRGQVEPAGRRRRASAWPPAPASTWPRCRPRWAGWRPRRSGSSAGGARWPGGCSTAGACWPGATAGAPPRAP